MSPKNKKDTQDVAVVSPAGPAASSAAVKKDAPVGEPGVVPAAKRPKVDAVPNPRDTKKTTLPPKDSSDAGSRETMKCLVPWVMHTLPEVLEAMNIITAKQDLKSAKPLDIPSSHSATLSSYKEPWVPAHCMSACALSGVYEAGGNLLWIDPEIACDEKMPFPDPAWNMLCQAADSQFVASDHKGVRRIRFPVPLSCWWRLGVPALPTTSYPSGGLVPLGGKAFIWAWYLAMFHALDHNDLPRVQLLYQCSLTVTITMFTEDDMQKLTEESIRMSETGRLCMQMGADSFVTFAEKIILHSQGKLNLTDLVQRDIRFNGGLINATMINVIKSLQPMLQSKDVVEKLTQLDRQHGQDVLSGSYNKLKLLLAHLKGDTAMFAWVLESMITALNRKEVTANNFLLQSYQKTRNGSPNFVQMSMATRMMVEHLVALANGVATVDSDLACLLKDKVLSKLRSPSLYNEAFPIADMPDAVEGSGVEASEHDTLMETLNAGSPRSAILLAELLQNVYQGSFQEAAVNIANHDNPSQLFHSMDADALKTFAKSVSELMRALHASETVVSLDAGAGAPKATLRDLARQASDGGDDEAAAAERQDVWNRAVAQRKKLVTLALVKNTRLRASYLEAFNKCSGVAAFRGKVGESHRVFVLSCDLLNQKGKQPWLEASCPDEKVFDEMCGFLTTHARGPCDVVMAWDGCHRKCRRSLEDTVGKQTPCAEVFMVYASSWNGWIKKKYFLGSENTECGFIVMPCSKTRQGVKQRADGFNAAGELSSHWTSFTGVSLPGRSTLPRISVADKLKVFPDITEPLPAKWLDHVPAGVPMFWGENKSAETWWLLLEEVQAGCVVDLSPGSGALASACMQRGTQYLGLLGSALHMTWLTTVVDRASLKFICESGSYLYQEDLATHLNELFADVVDPPEDKNLEESICDGEEDAE